MQQAATTPATITLADGKERVLRFSNGALKKIKAQYNVSVIREGPAKLFEKVSEEELAALLVLGLDHKLEGGQPGITEAEIDELLDAQNAGVACQQVFQALGASILKNALDVVRKWMSDQQKAAQKLADPIPAVAEKPSPEIPTPDPTTVM